MDLAIGLPLRNKDALNSLLQQLYDPSSPNYRHYLTPDQFTEQFGPTEQDYQALIDFARTNGLTVTATYPNRAVLDVSGSVADIERVFHVTLRTYRHPTENRTFYAPDVEPSLDLTVPVLHVSGLDNYIQPRPMSVKVIPMAQRPGVTSALGSGPSSAYMGNDFRAAYVPGVSLTGAGQSVALFELDGYYPNDIHSYELSNSLPAVPLTPILVDEASAPPGAGNGEVALDIEVAIAMAPGISNVLVYQGPNPATSANIVHLLNRIATDNIAKQISSSWLIGDDPNFDAVYVRYAAQGQSFFQASGDDDAFYPGIPQSTDDTNITLVGGTTLFTGGPAGPWLSETVWNTGTDSGSGGGISLTGYSIPSWQQGINMTTNQGSTTLRNVPDVAMTADNIFIVADNGNPEFVGGTSAAAPLWAAFTALVNQQAVASGRPTVGFINPAVYAIGKGPFYTSDFRDIITGNNTNSNVPNNFFAVPGYDLCTGWGTPNGLDLIIALATPDALGVLPGTGFTFSGPVGGPFSITNQNFSVTNTGGVALTWSVPGVPTWLNVVPSSGTLASGASTTVAVSLNAPNSLPAGAYTATLLFSNQTSQVVQPRQLALNVQAPNLVQNGGFEAGLSFISWTVNNNDGYNFVDNGTQTSGFIVPHSGANFAAFGQFSL
ncbi:MAG TPA: protease pro-enzyme activation domain-containing protein, partial [Verrucomicrobiae bacterium]|nr:protease pro-enzyme activation domain-containing protein [Verrucomicrobiae bacterium]